MRTRGAVYLILVAGMLVTGCGGTVTPLPQNQVALRADTMTKAALLDKLRANSATVKTLVVKKSVLKPSRMQNNDSIKDYADVSGRIAVDRPGRHLRLDIEKVAITVAEMVSDGQQYRVSIPLKGKFGVGDELAPVQGADFPYNLRPSHILDALFVDGEQLVGKPDIGSVMTEETKPQTDGLHSYYRILFYKTGGIPLEEIWFDRTVGVVAVVNKRSFRPDGKVEADIQYSNYATLDSISFPKTIVIKRPIENYSLEMDIEEMELNNPVSASVFVLNRPSGYDEVDLNTGKDIIPK